MFHILLQRNGCFLHARCALFIHIWRVTGDAVKVAALFLGPVVMTSKYHRLDRYLAGRLNISRAAVKPILAQHRVQVDGAVCDDPACRIGPFSHISVDQQVLQDCVPRYLMLHKPAGVVSATRDPVHRTVLDLLPESQRNGLHIAGRLDFHSTGLVLLSNDGRWTRQLSDPVHQIWKRYRVTLSMPLPASAADAFAAGMYFPFEQLTTRPARLLRLDDTTAQVSLQEGRYHQIRRMFARLDNKVTSLHREAIGPIELDPALTPGAYRALTAQEIAATMLTS